MIGRRVVLMGCCVLGLAAPLAAQIVPAGQPIQIEFAHDGLYTTAYRVLVDGTASGVDRPTSILTAGVARTTVAPVTVGAHTVTVCAVGSEVICTLPLAFSASVPPPTAPTGLRIVIQIALHRDGTGTLAPTAE